MYQPIPDLEVMAPTDPEVEQATLDVSPPRVCYGDLPCKKPRKPKNILGSKRGLFYTLLAISLLGILGGLAAGIGLKLASLISSSNGV